MPKYVERFEVEWDESVTEKVPIDRRDPDGYTVTGFTTRYLGKKRMRAEVEITIDTDEIASMIGPRAGRNKSGKATQANGLIRVKRVGPSREVSRTLDPNPRDY